MDEIDTSFRQWAKSKLTFREYMDEYASKARAKAYEECLELAERKFYPGPYGGLVLATPEAIAKAIRQHSQKGKT